MAEKSQQETSHLQSEPHRRFNPLLGTWIVVSPHRAQRPWTGQQEKSSELNTPHGDNSGITTTQPPNPLSPGAIRSSGLQNDDYTSIYIFPNDFPALKSNQSIMVENKPKENEEDCLFQVKPATGNCWVMCFHPNSNVNLATMTTDEVQSVLRKWCNLLRDQSHEYTWVQIFENRGEIMGCSNPHPHCQIWSSHFLPHEPTIKHQRQLDYFNSHDGRPMLLDYIEKEKNNKSERILFENEHWICLVPFWAQWPFETMLVPLRHVTRLYDLNENEIVSLSLIMQQLLIVYDNLFQCSFPYSMGWCGAPTGPYLNEDCSHWQLHALYYPPLLRSATVKKFVAGFELFAEVQRDLTAEKAASILKSVDHSRHYSK